MSYRPGNIYYKQVTTFNASGISTNTDSTPWGTLVQNGVDDFTAKVFTTNVDIGRYTVSGTIPAGYALGNSVSVCVSGQVAGSLSKYIIDLGALDGWTTTEMNQFRYKLGLDGTATAPVNQFAGHLELSASGVDAIMVESNTNLRQAATINSAVLCGVSSGAGSWIWYEGINRASQNRLSSNATSGIRQTVNYVLP